MSRIGGGDTQKQQKTRRRAGRRRLFSGVFELLKRKHRRNHAVRHILRTEIIRPFGITSGTFGVILFAFLPCAFFYATGEAIRLALEEGFGFESFVFMMVEHIRLQCFQKFRVHAAYAQAVKCIRKDRVFCFGNLERAPRGIPFPGARSSDTCVPLPAGPRNKSQFAFLNSQNKLPLYKRNSL